MPDSLTVTDGDGDEARFDRSPQALAYVRTTEAGVLLSADDCHRIIRWLQGTTGMAGDVVEAA